jgi:DNA-directed RNA polymerase subunit H (RpoH/RPB5)
VYPCGAGSIQKKNQKKKTSFFVSSARFSYFARSGNVKKKFFFWQMTHMQRAVRRLFQDRGFTAFMQPAVEDQNEQKEQKEGDQHEADDHQALGPLADLVASFGFALLGIALSGPGSSSYDPFVIRTAQRVAAEVEPEQKKKTRAQLREQFSILENPFDRLGHRQHQCEQVLVLQNVVKGKAVSVKALRELIILVRELGVQRLILCVEKKLTGNAFGLSSYGLELEWQPVPLINVIDHILVPPHRRLSQGEARDVRARIPGICAQIRKSDDPVARYYGFPIRSLIEILLPIEATGTMPEYRVVVV